MLGPGPAGQHAEVVHAEGQTQAPGDGHDHQLLAPFAPGQLQQARGTDKTHHRRDCVGQHQGVSLPDPEGQVEQRLQQHTSEQHRDQGLGAGLGKSSE